jgi:V/A-type H+-transporting ATPase subunit F
MALKVASIGDRESVLGMSVLGVRPCPVTEPREVPALLESLLREDYRIIFVTEELAAPWRHEIAEHMAATEASILMVPSRKGSRGRGLELVREMGIRALGADVLYEARENAR